MIRYYKLMGKVWRILGLLPDRTNSHVTSKLQRQNSSQTAAQNNWFDLVQPSSVQLNFHRANISSCCSAVQSFFLGVHCFQASASSRFGSVQSAPNENVASSHPRPQSGVFGKTLCFRHRVISVILISLSKERKQSASSRPDNERALGHFSSFHCISVRT